MSSLCQCSCARQGCAESIHPSESGHFRLQLFLMLALLPGNLSTSAKLSPRRFNVHSAHLRNSVLKVANLESSKMSDQVSVLGRSLGNVGARKTLQAERYTSTRRCLAAELRMRGPLRSAIRNYPHGDVVVPVASVYCNRRRCPNGGISAGQPCRARSTSQITP